jgi:hypothetical protein
LVVRKALSATERPPHSLGQEPTHAPQQAARELFQLVGLRHDDSFVDPDDETWLMDYVFDFASYVLARPGTQPHSTRITL